MNRLLLGLFWVFAIVYLATMHRAPFPAHWLVKAIPALSLAVLVKRNLEGRLGLLLAAALIFSAGGDIVLSFQEEGARAYFVEGLGLFLVAQLFYIVAFALDRKYQPARLPLMLGIVALSGVMTMILLPHLGAMLIPVLVYLVVITGMGLMAALNTRGGLLLIVGAVLFLVSDATIAIDAFLWSAPHPVAPYVIMLTYYAAQFCIAMAFVRRNIFPAPDG